MQFELRRKQLPSFHLLLAYARPDTVIDYQHAAFTACIVIRVCGLELLQGV